MKETSFGNIHEKRGKKYVYEGALKLQTINNSYLISYAGTLDHIDEVFDLLHIQLTSGIDIYSAFNTIANSISYNDIDFLVGFIQNDTPKLVHFNGEEAVGKEFCHIGSGISRESWTYRNELLLERNKDIRISPTQSLTSTINILQIYSLKDNMMDIGVGGLVFGARINSEGIHWCKDITYYLYNQDLLNYQLITVIARDNNLHVLSSLNNKHLIFVNRENEISLEGILNSHSEFLHKSSTDYFVFASLFYPSIVLIQINGKLHNEYFRMYYCRDGIFTHYRFIITPELIGLILGESFPEDEIVVFQWEFALAVEYKSRKNVIVENGHQNLVEDFDDERFI
ncbi:hypothetical protein CSV63_12880 [Sporosarcina sp. P34]|uniref:hypothetical protein n=1 Tax=Sporosarcina sp. P34 TaxID=2048247 RepID=UPI000C166175|nr:hypothetical protein [Sporosarcina sp. P34]PID14415.1 hypothetical protein CSV63_12880 [Sporosarcina sp. P34]